MVLLLLFWTAVAAGPPSLTPVHETVFVAFDTETTGFSCEKDRVVEVGAVRFLGDGTVLASTNWLVNPERDVPFYATNVHGITTEMVAEAPSFAEVWNPFEAFCSGSVLMAHNARFDEGFLRSELRRADIEMPGMEIVDTVRLFRRWFPDAPGHSLEALAGWLNIPSGSLHRADEDSMLVVLIFAEGVKQVDGAMLHADDYLKR